MWYKAKCVRECIFRGVRRKPGQIYEGPVKPPVHFEILEKRADDTSVVTKRTVCPFCGNEQLSAEDRANGVHLTQAEYDELLAMAEQAKTAGGDDDPGKKYNQLKSMNKDKLVEYAKTLGLELEMAASKESMIDTIQAREAEIANEGVN